MIYRAFCEICADDVNGRYTAYGIACAQKILHDVTLDAGQASRLAQRMTQEDVAVCHMQCVVEDFLAGEGV